MKESKTKVTKSHFSWLMSLALVLMAFLSPSLATSAWAEEASEPKPLTFTVIQAGTLLVSGIDLATNLQCRIDNGEWTPVTSENTYFYISLNEGQTISFRADDIAIATSGSQGGFKLRSKYGEEGRCNVSGNLLSLLNYNSANIKERQFEYFFYTNSAIVDASELILPSENITSDCFRNMFSTCDNLTVAPKTLPAKELAQNCYYAMFISCTSLTTAPELPAIKLANYCYKYMFGDCTSLKTAPALPAKSIYSYAYEKMFSGCSALENAPVISATWVGTRGCFEMFKDCRALTKAPALPATQLYREAYYSMFEGCWSLTEAPVLPAENTVDALNYKSYTRMFYDCTRITRLVTNFKDPQEIANVTTGPKGGEFYCSKPVYDYIMETRKTKSTYLSSWTVLPICEALEEYHKPAFFEAEGDKHEELCSFCKKPYNNSHDFAYDANEDNAEGHTCTVCGLVVAHKYDDWAHQQETKDGKETFSHLHKCVYCDKTNGDAAACVASAQKEIENTIASTCSKRGTHDEVTYCKVCHQEMARTAVDEPIVEHTHTAESPFTCTICGADNIRMGNCGKEGDNVRYALAINSDGETFTLYIVGSGEMEDRQNMYYSAPWSAYSNKTTAIVVSEGVTTIGKYAFYEMTNVENVTLPSSLTTISQDAFAYCKKLGLVKIPDAVTYIGSYAFNSSNAKICLNEGLSQVRSYALNSCTLTDAEGNAKAELPSSDKNYLYSRSLDEIKNTEIVLPDAITSLASNLFGGEDLKSITLGRNVTDVDLDAFASLTGEVTIKVPCSIPGIEERIRTSCTSNATLNVERFHVSEFACSAKCMCGEKDIDEAVAHTYDSDCDHSCNVCGLERTTTAEHEYENHCCKHCKEMETGYIDAGKLGDNISWVVTDFDGDGKYKLEIEGEGMISHFGSADNQPWQKYKSKIESAAVGEGITAIGNYTFEDLTSLENVELPSTLEYIHTRAFGYCEGLTSVDLPVGLKYVGYEAFYNCFYLAQVTIPCSVTGFEDNAFYHVHHTAFFYVVEGSKAESYLKERKTAYEAFWSITTSESHEFGEYASDNNATCTADGTKTAKCKYCSATDTIAEEGTALGHDFGTDGYCKHECGEYDESKDESHTATSIESINSDHSHTVVKTIKDGRVVIIRDGEKYDIAGRKL